MICTMSTPARRRTRPEPPARPREGSWGGLRRRARRKLIDAHDWIIHTLYELIAWLDVHGPAEKRYFRVAIFGSSRIRTEDAQYAQVRELARQLSYIGCDIVTGGGPGLMMAANEGARSGAYRFGTRSFGLTILLPLEEQPNPFLDEVQSHKTFFSRLHQFIRLSHAYIVVEGGVGTTLESLMVLQLLQVEVLADRTLIFVGSMWRGLRDWLRDDVVARGLAGSDLLELAHWVDTIEEAIDLVRVERDRFLERNEVVLPPPVAAAPDPASGEGLTADV
jgi:uncharacterized protein (TIGR00730 family)